MSNWQPIETAPKDGTRILLFRPSGFSGCEIIFGHWDDEKYRKNPNPFWTHDHNYLTKRKQSRSFPPTHWQPIPAPPEWQDIATAPKDETRIDLWCTHLGIGITSQRSPDMRWRDGKWCNTPWNEELNPGWVATHWRPLPEPPDEEGAP